MYKSYRMVINKVDFDKVKRLLLDKTVAFDVVLITLVEVEHVYVEVRLGWDGEKDIYQLMDEAKDLLDRNGIWVV